MEKKPSLGQSILMTLVGVLLVYLIIFVGALARNAFVSFYYIGQADRGERSITVSADGEVEITPDVAQTTMGFETEAPTIAEAQEKNTDIMNTLVARVKAAGIEEKDIQTSNYNVYPVYDYVPTTGEQRLRGYKVAQNVTVKIRDLDKTSSILGLAGETGANNVSGLTFSIDDPEVYEDRARTEAIDEAFVKAKNLSKELNVKLVRVLSYAESVGGGTPAPYPYLMREMAADAAAPQIEAGSEKVVVSVSVTYEIR